MSTSNLTIAIVGAGIAGLTAAAALRKFGLKATIYEQAPAFGRVGAGLQLTPNAVKVLRGLDLEQRMLSVSFAPEVGYNRVWNSGAVTYLHPMGRDIEQRYGAPDLSMHRAALHAALASCLAAESIRFGMTLDGLDPSPGGVRLRFRDGSTVRADAVIGADGMHSLVRKLLVGTEQPRFTGQVAYRAVYRSTLIGRSVDDRVKWWGEGRHIVSYKVDPQRNETYFIASTPEPDFKTESWSAMGEKDVLLEAYAGFHPDALALLQAAPEVRKWALLERDPLPCWAADRLIVIGDAAHPMLPYMAQGAGTAMEDAIILARCLHADSGEGVQSALARCDRNRRQRTTRIQLEARQNTWMLSKSSTPTDWVYDYDAWGVPLV